MERLSPGTKQTVLSKQVSVKRGSTVSVILVGIFHSESKGRLRKHKERFTGWA